MSYTADYHVAMYEESFGLTANPFLMTPDPHFLFLTAAHREALAGLVYALVKRKGMALLTGEAGTGKTTLLRTLLESIPAAVAEFALIIHPTLDPDEFLEMILLELGMPEVPAGKPRRLLALEQLLLQRYTEGKVVALILDEAHKLSAELLEEVRLLTNFENSQGKLLQIVLAAQTELDDTLARKELRQLKQRIACRFTVRPLSPEETAAYVAYRWERAGGASPHPFGEDTLDYLGYFSAGIPRVINAICDNALVSAYADGLREVRPEHIIMAAKDLVWHPRPDPPSAADPADDEPTRWLLWRKAGQGAGGGTGDAQLTRRAPPAQ